MDLSRMPGSVTFMPATDALSIWWENQTSIDPGTNISFVARNIKFPTSRQGELPKLGIRTFDELGKMVHQNQDVYGKPLAEGQLRHVAATVVYGKDRPYVMFNDTFVLNISFQFSA